MKMRTPFSSILLFSALLLFLPISHAALISDFDDGTFQGWTEGDPFNKGSFGGYINLLDSGGNPGGYLRATDTISGGGSLAILAPITLTGDLTLLGGLMWDVLLPTEAIASTSLLIESFSGTFYRSNHDLLGSEPKNSWFTKSADFTSDTGWDLIGTGSESFFSVVSNAKALYIELDVTTCCTTEAGLDNVRTFTTTTPIPVANTLWLIITGLSYFFFSKKLKSTSFVAREFNL